MRRLFCALALFSITSAIGIAAEHSELWGANGEEWDARSRLPDFSFAGYHRGEKPLPTLPAGRSVRDFGAKGDGTADDSEAFESALREVQKGVIEIPEGHYKLSRIFEIRRSGVVLRGAGPDKTALALEIPLNDIKPNWGATTTGDRTSNYSWSGGYFVFRGDFASKMLAEITALARRGDKALQVSTVAGLRVGQSVEIYQTDTADNSLAIHLYSGDSGPVENIKGRTGSSLVARIVSINGNRIELDRALRCDVELVWKPQVRSFEPTVTESGIENLSFEFPNQPYKGHFTELGFNAVAFSGVANCWARNVRIVNADSGIFVSGHFNTIDGIVIESARAPDRQGCVGHHGISVSGGDNHVSHFDFRARFIHDLTVTHCAGNVFSEGQGVDLSLDHHRRAPYENLFTALNAGAGTRLWKSGGGAKLGYHCGARGTFWNIRADRALQYPPRSFGPASLNVVGLATDQKSETGAGKWFEAIRPDELTPKNLHAAQLQRRLANSNATKWKLEWADEFETAGHPDPSRWANEVGFIRNKEKQYYTAKRLENARVEGGRLIIEARKEKFPNARHEAGSSEWRRVENAEITSASLTTRGKAEWTGGRVEVRAKLPRGRGVWPAIWMLGVDRERVGWPRCGEIDIMEYVGFEPDVIHANIHTGKYNHARGTGKGDRVQVQAPFDGFHVYAVEWRSDRLDFFVDDKKYFTYAKEKDAGKEVWPFDQPHYLILNLAIGGEWGGQRGVDDSIFPQRFEIDYVRVFKGED